MKRRGFTLIELLVVVAIIALLIAILLPSLGRARDTAKTVRCSSNLKQVYIGMELYAAQNDNTMMPSEMKNSGNNFQGGLWAGYDMMGLQFGTMGGDTGINSGTAQANVNKAIRKMLDCPNVNHEAAWGGQIDSANSNGPWWADYTYNENVGQMESIPSPKSNKGIPLNAVKRTQVRGTTLMCLDVREKTAKGDYYYMNDSNLVPPVDPIGGSIADANTGIQFNGTGIAGIVHAQGKKTNLLFADGTILTDDILKLLPINSKNWIVDFRMPADSQTPFQ